MIIYLGRRLPVLSGSLPEGRPNAAFSRVGKGTGRAPASGSSLCLALLPMGVAWPHRLPRAPVVSYTTFSPLRPGITPGFAVCLCGPVRGSPRPGVTRHRTLWSPDFPHPQHAARSGAATTRPTQVQNDVSTAILPQNQLTSIVRPGEGWRGEFWCRRSMERGRLVHAVCRSTSTRWADPSAGGAELPKDGLGRREEAGAGCAKPLKSQAARDVERRLVLQVPPLLVALAPARACRQCPI